MGRYRNWGRSMIDWKVKNNPTEATVNAINLNVFFKEFTFSKSDFKGHQGELELADHVVWLDELFFVYQIKDRLAGEIDNNQKWFKKKVIDKAVQQIKNTLKYLNDYPDIIIKNNKGHSFNVAEANLSDIKKIIIYTPGSDFSEETRNLKFYDSQQVGLIHLFHSEDYFWICKYLLTPAEVEEYLAFREDFYLAQPKVVVHFPEQYVLGHFLETLRVDHIEPAYINNLKILDEEGPDFDMSVIIKNFTKQLTLVNGPMEYYAIIKEISKLKRSELAEFKKRFVNATEACKYDEITLPYRIYVPRTGCAFVFIPLPKNKIQHWKTALANFTLAQKYDQKARKCLGVVVFDDIVDGERYFNLFWMFAESEWEYEEEFEKRLQENFPFREVSMRRIDNRYKSE